VDYLHNETNIYKSRMKFYDFLLFGMHEGKVIKKYISIYISLGDFEDTKEADTPKDRNTQRRDDFSLCQDNLKDAAYHNEAVEAIEERDKVALELCKSKKERAHLKFHFVRCLAQLLVKVLNEIELHVLVCVTFLL